MDLKYLSLIEQDYINKITGKIHSEHTAVLQALVWGVEPGVTDIFTAVDSGFSSLNGRIRKASIKEYYHICGFNPVTQRRMQHQQHNQEDVRFINKLSTTKHQI
ncbi:hypothetical protein G6F57_001279 [Rhizopus arrhizus]|uniref:Uncharacterized protein n=1 Tax=Rhizopus oryzae TaxID=64495 RepID=A0A9P6XEP3_RHIOR|nr:hypothetical protein G6F23_001939 [Rhizopus arrhizus]KAG1417228.1 hypothetical protein G6F58_005611 [Rhizopus delemar]KAG0766837.1 hypothetical protein G6F24_003282 [Rhizopus arrhizus]KAG0793607.1 hypothetical protein G6F21_003485 [Rhizopus arrhizus]KAG0820002.1 hypothetical protein G6F20_000286 [Rhizopus arrhizus]